MSDGIQVDDVGVRVNDVGILISTGEPCCCSGGVCFNETCPHCAGCATTPKSFVATITNCSVEALIGVAVDLAKTDDCSYVGTHAGYTYTISISKGGSPGDADTYDQCYSQVTLTVTGPDAFSLSVTTDTPDYNTECCCPKGLIDVSEETSDAATVKGICCEPQYLLLQTDFCPNSNFQSSFYCDCSGVETTRQWLGVMKRAGDTSVWNDYTCRPVRVYILNGSSDCELDYAIIDVNPDNHAQMRMRIYGTEGLVWEGRKCAGKIVGGECVEDGCTGRSAGKYLTFDHCDQGDLVEGIRSMSEVWAVEICPSCVQSLPCTPCDRCNSDNPDDKYTGTPGTVILTLGGQSCLEEGGECDIGYGSDCLLLMTGGSIELPNTSGCGWESAVPDDGSEGGQIFAAGVTLDCGSRGETECEHQVTNIPFKFTVARRSIGPHANKRWDFSMGELRHPLVEGGEGSWENNPDGLAAQGFTDVDGTCCDGGSGTSTGLARGGVTCSGGLPAFSVEPG